LRRGRRSLLRSKRAIVGIEAAIILIAFVVIASALAYVAINMGFFASQKSKDTISRGISEATSALELDGVVIAKTSGGKVKYIAFPVKLSVGRSEVDLGQNATVVSVYAPDDSFALLDIYQGVNQSLSDPTDLDTVISSLPSTASAIFVIYNDDNDTVLERNEKAFLVINLGTNTVDEYHNVKIEVKTEKGATLTVERSIPGGLPTNDYVDLG